MPKFSFSLYRFYHHLKSSKRVTLFLFIILFIIVSYFFTPLLLNILGKGRFWTQTRGTVSDMW